MFGLKADYEIDYSVLEANFAQLSMQFHPDNFEKKDEIFAATLKIMEINQGYEILKNDIKRGKYLLKMLANIDIESDKNIKPDMDFLELVLSLSEAFSKSKNEDEILGYIGQYDVLLRQAFKDGNFALFAKYLLCKIYLSSIIEHQK
ncbi:Co-chaperone protein HscB [Candidatus Deianiraea vastatrix]|uniref:Co-chaperone protein HscB n=2 Tax=Candidatus Deianiraea vastatrix TaxID=2163644 RepID=A0A5B8XE20_9RICK|nr:Co-chaperone protein HscB [Candidatus Deianiraea vastatrix]